MLRFFLLAIFHGSVLSYGGYDSGGGTANSCGRPYRAGKMHIPPCNVAKEGGYCKTPGENYPWQAVKRFVKENRGLMRRMYGEQPEATVMREELARSYVTGFPQERLPRMDEPDMDNDLYRDDEDDFEDLFHDSYLNKIKKEYDLKFEGRYMHDSDVMNTKFIYSEEPAISIKLAGLKTAPHFRPASTSTTTSSTSTTQESTSKTLISSKQSTLTVEAKTTESELEVENTTLSFNETDKTTEIDDSTITTEDDKTTTSTTTASSKVTPKKKISGMLFQDMEEEGPEKIKINYKLAGVNACPVKEEVVAPFWANNTRGEVLALLNMYPFEQYVHWEKCSFENKQMYCRDGCRCEQQYRLHRLLAYDPHNECKGIFSDWFRFPSCCICKCYGLPPEFRVTSRSPRNGDKRGSNDD